MNYINAYKLRIKIATLLQHTDLTHEQIAKKLKCSLSSLKRVKRKINNNKSLKISITPHSKRALNLVQQNYLKQAIRRTPRATPRELVTYLNNKYNIHVSVSTVQRERRRLNFRPLADKIIEPLTKKQKSDRVNYAL